MSSSEWYCIQRLKMDLSAANEYSTRLLFQQLYSMLTMFCCLVMYVLNWIIHGLANWMFVYVVLKSSMCIFTYVLLYFNLLLLCVLLFVSTINTHRLVVTRISLTKIHSLFVTMWWHSSYSSIIFSLKLSTLLVQLFIKVYIPM